MNLIKQNNRIEYIDALRGFTMVLVVFYHLSLYSFKSDSTIVNQLFMSFRMPLFFFISGFIGYKSGIDWNGQTWWIMTRKKIVVQLTPTIVFGCIYAYLYLHIDMSTFIMDMTKYGYWFTIVLLEMFIIVYSMNTVVYNDDPSVFMKRQILILVLLSVIFFTTKYILAANPVINKLNNIFSLYCLFRYFPYFAIGYVCAMNKEKFHNILNAQYFSFVVIILFLTAFYINSTYIYPNIATSSLRIIYHLLTTVIGVLGLLMVYNTFRIYKDTFASTTRIGRLFQYIGRRTLDIYVLHWFFLPVLPQVTHILSLSQNTLLELILGGGLSLIVISICLIVSAVLRTSPILAQYLFGVKSRDFLQR